jgi:hypothetical protein
MYGIDIEAVFHHIYVMKCAIRGKMCCGGTPTAAAGHREKHKISAR